MNASARPPSGLPGPASAPAAGAAAPARPPATKAADAGKPLAKPAARPVGDAVEVSILGQTYVLRTSRDGVATVRLAAARVDQEMSKIRDQGKIRARERTAVLAALNLAVELETAPPPAAAVAADSAPGSAPGQHAQRERLQHLLDRLDAAIQAGPQPV